LPDDQAEDEIETDLTHEKEQVNHMERFATNQYIRKGHCDGK